MEGNQTREGGAWRNFSMQFREEDYNALTRISKQRDVPKAVVIRELVRELLKREERKMTA